MTDCCIIGGGIIGLSLARELAGRGLSVRVLAREQGRATASWAAAGIFPPAPLGPDCSPGDRLTGWSDLLHREWSTQLREETGIDNGLQACGGLHVAAGGRGLAVLETEAAHWRGRGARCDLLDAAGVAACEPALAGAIDRGSVVAGYLLPEEMQIRPPRHLEAIESSCRKRGVTIDSAEVHDLVVQHGKVEHVATAAGKVRAKTYCLAAGAWSGGMAEQLGLSMQTRPIRGQILLLRLPRQTLTRVVNQGLEYLVPRADGRLLVGSTIEDAGFAATTTEGAIERLSQVARRMLGDLPGAETEQAWAGLRPGSVDGLPCMGWAPKVENVCISAGHFRAGLHQSTGSAVLVADLITGSRPTIDPAPFDPARPTLVSTAGAPPDSVEAYLARAAAEAAN